MGKIKIKKSGQSQQCRCCLKEIGLKELWTEYYNGEEREVYGEMVNDCFALPWEPLFGKTEHICDSCITRLRDAVSFKREILYSNQLLNQEAKNESKLSVKQEEESDLEMETEYLSIEFMDDEDKNLMEIKIEQESKSEMTVKEESSPSKRGKRYTEDDLKKCMEAVMSGKMSQTKASIVYHVPRKTISAAVARRHRARNKTSESNAKGDKETSETSIEMNDFQHRMFPELLNFGNDLSVLLDCSNATPIRCRGGIGYKCCFCPEEFPDAADLKRHTFKGHDTKTRCGLIKGKYGASSLVKLDITSLQCTICYKHIDTIEHLIDHLVDDHGKNIHRDIKNYILPFKFHGEEIRCIICFTLFNKFKVLQEHMSTHYRNFVCDYCSAGFVTRTILLNHIKGHDFGLYKCDYCPKTYNTQRKKKAHERLVHIHRNMLNKCGYCNEKFNRFQKKEEHLVRVHGVRSVAIECQACDKTFVSQRALRDHTKRDHLLERRHRCDECGMMFFRQSDVRKHMVKHTGARTFQCEVCLKAYGRRNTLREHMRIHADDRRFKCEYCGQAFVQKCSWRGHMRSKHGEQFSNVPS
ncbi:zinc finger protein 43-like isoform X3 [Maniola jurtina]|uniref:zinc finger protein 43-like isoform X2 n=1 Tax=Maniola jurtina TaxID=191418 RepID=UPI001E68AA0D|nr:zinc finger protein 43-like isoform X2 [Maniola jurtina]XP_045781611.1 zinc finger protein 43-like isoform X3 [Maniola jurtina]